MTELETRIRARLEPLLIGQVIEEGRLQSSLPWLGKRAVVVGLRCWSTEQNKERAWTVLMKADGDERDYSYSIGLIAFMSHEEIDAIFDEFST